MWGVGGDSVVFLHPVMRVIWAVVKEGRVDRGLGNDARYVVNRKLHLLQRNAESMGKAFAIIYMIRVSFTCIRRQGYN